jgi:hypothetical protein
MAIVFFTCVKPGCYARWPCKENANAEPPYLLYKGATQQPYYSSIAAGNTKAVFTAKGFKKVFTIFMLKL